MGMFGKSRLDPSAYALDPQTIAILQRAGNLGVPGWGGVPGGAEIGNAPSPGAGGQGAMPADPGEPPIRRGMIGSSGPGAQLPAALRPGPDAGSSDPYADLDSGVRHHGFPARLLNALAINFAGVDVLGAKDRIAQRSALQRAQLAAANVLSPITGTQRQARITDPEGNDISDAFAPQMEGAPSRRRTPAEIAEALAQIKARVPGFNPDDYRELAGLAQQGERSRAIEGPDGIYSDDGQGGFKRVTAYPAKGPTVSPGWRQTANGGWEPVEGGPYDPAYIAKAAGTRRDVIVSKPLPSRARGGGRGVSHPGYTGLPPSYRPQ